MTSFLTVRRSLPAALLALTPIVAPSQAPKAIPIRKVAPIEATTTETWSFFQIKVWERSDGRILLTDRQKGGKLILFDAKLRDGKVIADSSLVVAGMVAFGSFVAMPLPHDSIAVIDAGNAGVLVLDRDGKQARIMALPRGQDARNLGTGYYGNTIDPMGRLLYRVAFARAPGSLPPTLSLGTTDSMAIVRADFVRRVVDTVGAVFNDLGQINLPPIGDGPDALRQVKMIPGGGSDDWAVLADGSVAVVRHQDYHIDWIFPDGTRASTPKMPFDWRRRSDDEKQAIIDTVKTQVTRTDSMMKALTATRNAGPSLVPQRTWATITEIPDYTPPIRNVNSLYPDADNRLWILPTTSAQAQGGLLFDVVNKKGEIEERVQLPANALIVGFGKNGVVFLRILQPDGKSVIARTHIVR